MMPRTAYIATDAQGNYLNENFELAIQGFEAMGYPIVPFHDISATPVTKNDLVYGGINATLRALAHLGVSYPALLNAHEVLPRYVGRKVQETTLLEVRRGLGNAHYPFFIKPLRDNKLFGGYVAENAIFTTLKLRPYANDTPVLVSEYVKFVSEYRCFVTQGELVGVRLYKGPELEIDLSLVYAAIRDYRKSPEGYALDFGVTEDGRTLLVEINDGFGLGAYGLDALSYARLHYMRWYELVG